MDSIQKYKEYYDDYMDLCEKLDKSPVSFTGDWEEHHSSLQKLNGETIAAELKNTSDIKQALNK